ncbi:IclR family transcriptional regulator [Actinomyces procaprae]|uniref:IclR family transcriptional regulator n=1 Tax=Actinomyces procaprae TaxID=2560010 RepID=UPI00109DAA3E|nr:IclR family transcriptional regulator [Actinomyces procaprae]
MSETTDGTSAGDTGVREVKSAARTVELLEFLAGRHGSVTKLGDVVEGLGTPRSSAYALLQTLVARGWVETDPSGAEYSIGIRALLAGTSYLDRDPYIRLVDPVLSDTAFGLGETMHMGRLDGDQIVYLLTVESHEYRRYHHRVGRRMPATLTSLGKAVLSEHPDVTITEFPAPLTPHSIDTAPALAADLERTRERGYAIDDEESQTGLRCFGVPLRYSSPVRNSISCSVPIDRLTPGRTETIVSALLRMRERIEWSAPVAAR